MATKSFKKPVYENLGVMKIESEPQVEHIQVPEVKPILESNEPIAKKKVGRPKTKDVKGTCKNVNVALPISLLSQWEEVKMVHGSNLTAYITKLIEKDMNTNYSTYKTILDNLNYLK